MRFIDIWRIVGDMIRFSLGLDWGYGGMLGVGEADWLMLSRICI